MLYFATLTFEVRYSLLVILKFTLDLTVELRAGGRILFSLCIYCFTLYFYVLTHGLRAHWRVQQLGREA